MNADYEILEYTVLEKIQSFFHQTNTVEPDLFLRLDVIM